MGCTEFAFNDFAGPPRLGPGFVTQVVLLYVPLRLGNDVGGPWFPGAFYDDFPALSGRDGAELGEMVCFFADGKEVVSESWGPNADPWCGELGAAFGHYEAINSYE